MVQRKELWLVKMEEAYLHISYGQSRFTVHAQTDPGGCNTGYCQAMGGTILSPNTWYYLVGTFDGKQIKIYENGVLKQHRTGMQQLPTLHLSPL